MKLAFGKTGSDKTSVINAIAQTHPTVLPDALPTIKYIR